MIFSLEKLSHRYSDGTLAIDEISLNFTRGERVAFLGTNGSGKTTLLNHLNGILKPTSGNIYFEDKPLSYDAKSLLNLRKRVGFVFQDPNDQLFASSVKQDVAFGPLNLGYTPEHVKQLVDNALTTVKKTKFEDNPPH
jgi:cobalt/nickel transport system ATP-binding protein